MRSLIRSTPIALFVSGALCACGPTPEQLQEEALTGVKSYVEDNLVEFHRATSALCETAPAPDVDGWNVTDDATAVEVMRTEWKKARIAYEHVEGAIAVLFPELDVATDERYDGFVAAEKDENLFDDEGVTGMHAVERILWSDAIPADVLEFEQGLPNYKAAAFPANEVEARDFKEKLCAKLVDDVGAMHAQFAPLALDTAAAFRGVIGSMQEQHEKATLAATGEEESRYARYTLADMRANVEGGRRIFEAFRPWLVEVGGEAEAVAIVDGLNRLKAAYDAIEGDALPPVPATWSSVKPSEQDLQTPFGKLFQLLMDETDASREGSTVHEMMHAAERLGIPQLPEE